MLCLNQSDHEQALIAGLLLFAAAAFVCAQVMRVCACMCPWAHVHAYQQA